MDTLVLLKDGSPHLSFSLRDSTLIGRSLDCEIQFMDPSLSRYHARLTRDAEAWKLEDLDSRNGTFYRGARLNRPVKLAPGDEFQIGRQVLLFNPPLQLLHAHVGGKSLYLIDDSETKDRLLPLTVPPDPSQLSPETIVELYDLVSEVIGELDIARFSNLLLARLTWLFGADRACILIRDPASEGLHPLAVKTAHDGIAVSKSLLDRLIATRAPMLFEASSSDPELAGATSVVRHDLRSALLVPLTENEATIGVIQLDSTRPRAFEPRDLSKLTFLARIVARALSNAQRFEKEERRGHSCTVPEPRQARFLGKDSCVLQLLHTVDRAAASEARVLLTGETGTGKELLGRMLHQRSGRSEGPWIAVNCAAIPSELVESELFGHEKGAFTGADRRKRGCFALADGGTLFLDEIAELDPAMQVKLLRAIQEGSFFPLGAEKPLHVNVRVIAATSRVLEHEVKAGRFREDLFYRLNVIRIHVPPLRDRSGDIQLLFRHFLDQYSRQAGRPPPAISSEAAGALRRYDWPGNVRELKNVAERLIVLTDASLITLRDLPEEIREPTRVSELKAGTMNLHNTIANLERRLINEALQQAKGNKTAACKMLGISRPTLNKKIADLQIELPM